MQLEDHIHGLIHLDGVHEALAKTGEMQRLHRVRQLGNAYLFFPGAMHTRFAHSHGTFAATCKLLDRLVAKGVIIPQEHKVMLRVASQLHDIGHWDLSHYVEHLAGNHEENTAAMIRGEVDIPNYTSGNIPDILKRHDIDPEVIIKLLKGEGDFPPFYYELLSGKVIDMDRLDYLARDIHATRVEDLNVGVSKLLDSLTVDPSEHLGIREEGVNALVSFLFARQQMYGTVYRSPKNYAARTMVIRAVQESEDIARPFLWGDDLLIDRLERKGSATTKRLLGHLKNANYYVPIQVSNIGEQELLALTGLREGEIIYTTRGGSKPKATPTFPLETGGQWIDFFSAKPAAAGYVAKDTEEKQQLVYVVPERALRVEKRIKKIKS